MPKKYKVELKEEDREQLQKLIEQGSDKNRKVKRCQILLLSDQGKKDKEIAEWIGVATTTVQRIRQRCVLEGWESAIEEKARIGRPIGIKTETRGKVTALACTDAPEGRERWTLRLLADKVVELKYIDRISHQSVDNILKKMN